jgi:hypothetical protein
MLSSCEFDRHIGMLLSSCGHLVSSTDTSACYYHLAVILCIRQTLRHATIILLSSCEFDRHIGMRSTDTSTCCHLVSSTDTSTCCHLVKSTDTSTCCHLVKSTDTSTCCHLVYSTDTSACYYHLAVVLCIPSCVFDRHIGMLLSSCCRLVSSTDTSACGRQTHRHATIILLSSCEFDRHIGMRSTDTSVCYYHLAVIL